MFDVVVIEPHTIRDRRVSLEAVDLGPSRNSRGKAVPSLYLRTSAMNRVAKNGRSGRSPTSDISPRRTLSSCGISSRLVFRKILPIEVTRASP